jgi:hypothetical protein
VPVSAPVSASVSVPVSSRFGFVCVCVYVRARAMCVVRVSLYPDLVAFWSIKTDKRIFLPDSRLLARSFMLHVTFSESTDYLMFSPQPGDRPKGEQKK